MKIEAYGKGSCLAGIAVGVMLASSGSASADVTDQLLDRLKEKGILSDTEYKTFKNKHAAEVRATKRERVRVVTREEPVGSGPVTPAPRIGGASVANDLVRTIAVKDQGIGVRVGQVDITLSGNVNAFAVQDFGASNRTGQPILGGLATGSRFLGGANEASASNATRNGLLPAAFLVNATTRQGNFDVGFEFGIYPGLNLGGNHRHRRQQRRQSSGLDLLGCRLPPDLLHGRQRSRGHGEGRARPRPVRQRCHPR